MRLFPLLATAFLLLVGCTGTAVINGSGGLGDPTGDDDDAADDDDDDAADDDDATEPNPFAGEHEFAAYMIADFNGGGDDVFCEGGIVFIIDAEGGLTGEGECASEWGGGGRSGYIFEVSGSVTDEGQVEGTISVARSREPDEWEDSPLSGTVTDPVDVGWTGEIQFGWDQVLVYTGKITTG